MSLDAEPIPFAQLRGETSELPLSRKLSGLQQEVSELFLRLRDPIFRYVIGIVGDAGEAEDVTQDAFLRLFTAMSKGEQIENSRAWLFHVGQNLAIDRRRRMSRVEHVEERVWQDLCEQTEDAGPNPQQAMLKREQHARVRAAFAGVSLQERRCLELRTEGLRYREIAAVLDVAISSVDKYLARAVRKITKELNV